MTRLSEARTDVYAIRTEANSVTVVMASDYGVGLTGLLFVFGGAAFIGLFLKSLASPEDRPGLLYNLPESLLGLVIPLLVALSGGWLIRWLVDLRSITVTPGRATVVWRLFGRPMRSFTFDVLLVVVHQVVWRDGSGSTDRVVLQGQERTHTVAAVWNMPPAGSFKFPFRDWRVGLASQLVAHGGSTDERTISPLMLDLAKSLASAASVPTVFAARESHRPWLNDWRLLI
jgi:hypothetical protein